MPFPPDVPNVDGDEPFTLGGMLRGWFTVMVPAALATYLQTKSIALSVGAALVTPAVALLQGSLVILNYRGKWGDSPAPLAPSHGVVVVNPEHANATTTTTSSNCCCNMNKNGTNGLNIQFGNAGCTCLSGKRWRRGGPLTPKEKQTVEDASNGKPLRILVIGDSLAVGVGSTRSCTPLMPEMIARTLSKALNGRAVYWTCHGAAGASAQWVEREFKRGLGYLREKEAVKTDTPVMTNGMVKETATPGGVGGDTPGLEGLELSDSSSDENSVADSEDSLTTCESSVAGPTGGEADNDNGVNLKDWRQRLDQFSGNFEPDMSGPYDVTVVMSGPNDLKSAFFPFLLQGEDSEFRKQAQQRGGSFDQELLRVIDTIQGRMTDKNEPQTPTNGITPRPLVVFPGMPANILPIFHHFPKRWLSIPICGIMDNHKRNLARKHSDDVLFVEAPDKKRLAEFEDQRGSYWRQREQEDTLLCLRSTTREQCRDIEGRMIDYYSSKGALHGHQHLYDDKLSQRCQHNPPVPKLSERKGVAGSKIIGVDLIHPNDEGMDYWGRHIGNEILEAWQENPTVRNERKTFA